MKRIFLSHMRKKMIAIYEDRMRLVMLKERKLSNHLLGKIYSFVHEDRHEYSCIVIKLIWLFVSSTSKIMSWGYKYENNDEESRRWNCYPVKEANELTHMHYLFSSFFFSILSVCLVQITFNPLISKSLFTSDVSRESRFGVSFLHLF